MFRSPGIIVLKGLSVRLGFGSSINELDGEVRGEWFVISDVGIDLGSGGWRLVGRFFQDI